MSQYKRAPTTANNTADHISSKCSTKRERWTSSSFVLDGLAVQCSVLYGFNISKSQRERLSKDGRNGKNWLSFGGN